MDSQAFCIVLTTTNRQENALQITQSLLSKQLAACVQSMPIQSHYMWNDEVCCDDEILLVIKTRKACYAELERELATLHSYEVPQIVQVPIVEGFHPYLAWIEQNTPR